MTDAPRMMFQDELVSSMADGAQFMIDMVRGSVFADGAMPPSDVWEWYVSGTAYRFVAEEYRAVYEPNEDTAHALEDVIAELEAVGKIVRAQKQFGLQNKVSEILRTRLLHMPSGYAPPYHHRLPI